MEILRIGEKTISLSRIHQKIEQILIMRSRGYSQQDAAEKIGIDRSFISRLECLGEIRKGKTIGVIGFPIMNKEEILEILEEYGISLYLLFTENERGFFVSSKSGLDLFNEVMELLSQFRNVDTVIIMASDKRIRLLEELLDNQVIPFEIGVSPLKEDIYVKPDVLKKLIEMVKVV